MSSKKRRSDGPSDKDAYDAMSDGEDAAEEQQREMPKASDEELSKRRILTVKRRKPAADPPAGGVAASNPFANFTGLTGVPGAAAAPAFSFGAPSTGVKSEGKSLFDFGATTTSSGSSGFSFTAGTSAVPASAAPSMLFPTTPGPAVAKTETATKGSDSNVSSSLQFGSSSSPPPPTMMGGVVFGAPGKAAELFKDSKPTITNPAVFSATFSGPPNSTGTTKKDEFRKLNASIAKEVQALSTEHADSDWTPLFDQYVKYAKNIRSVTNAILSPSPITTTTGTSNSAASILGSGSAVNSANNNKTSSTKVLDTSELIRSSVKAGLESATATKSSSGSLINLSASAPAPIPKAAESVKSVAPSLISFTSVPAAAGTTVEKGKDSESKSNWDFPPSSSTIVLSGSTTTPKGVDTKLAFPSTANSSGSIFNFGASPAFPAVAEKEKEKDKEGDKKANSSAFTFGGPSSSTGSAFVFGAPAPAPTLAPVPALTSSPLTKGPSTATPFTFGATSSITSEAPSTGFVFGAAPTADKSAPAPTPEKKSAPFTFGASASSGFNFGGESKETKAAPAFEFGASAKPDATSPKSFSFTAPGGATSTPFSFGASTSSTPAFSFDSKGTTSATPVLNFSNTTTTAFGMGSNAGLAAAPIAEGGEDVEAEKELHNQQHMDNAGVKSSAAAEEEETKFEVKAKIHKLVEGQWKVVGMGQLKLWRNKSSDTRRLVLYAETGKNLLNAALYAGLKTEQTNKDVTLNLMSEGKLVRHTIKVGSADSAQQLKVAIDSHLPTAE